MKTTYIIGHTKPDTDAVVSAMALEFLYKNKECFGQKNPQAVIANPLNPETTFLFKKFGVKPPKLITADKIQAEDSIVLVDHNEASQRLLRLDSEQLQSQIVEIVDHHKVNLNLNNPIFMTFKAWGSTCTIIYYIMKQNNVVPDKTLAALMLAAILSDTIGYKSATSTPKDKELGDELAKIAEITDVEPFTLEIFKAKSDISTLTDKEIVTNDYKIFDFNTQEGTIRKTMIDQLETVEQDIVLSEKKDNLLSTMQAVKAELGVALLFVAVTDILKINTKLLILSVAEKRVAEAAFGGTVENNILDIGPKMSRKKEIAPAIGDAIK